MTTKFLENFHEPSEKQVGHYWHNCESSSVSVAITNVPVYMAYIQLKCLSRRASWWRLSHLHILMWPFFWNSGCQIIEDFNGQVEKQHSGFFS